MIKLKDILFEGKLTESWSYRDYTYDQIHDIKGRIAYAQKALKQKDIKAWEKKEFTDLLKDLKKTLRIKSDHLKWIDKMEKQMGEGKLNEAKETIFDVAKRIVKDHSMEKYNGVKIDVQTANLITKIDKKINAEHRRKFLELSSKKKSLQNFLPLLWRLAK